MIKYHLTLVKEAKRSGGDKYRIEAAGDREKSIYVPQEYSRKGGAAYETLDIVLSETSPGPDGIELRMTKAARGSGDDKYEPFGNGVYLDKSLRSWENVYLQIICAQSQSVSDSDLDSPSSVVSTKIIKNPTSDDWTRYKNPDSGYYYLWNSSTRESKWE